jgi:hypothetical protein
MNKIVGAFLLAALCGGCETVVFEAPPVAAQACDPALVGNWLSKGDKPGTDGEVELRIAADCTLLFVEHEHGAPRAGDPTALHVGRDGRLRYGWVDARWAERRMQSTDAAAGESAYVAGDIVLFQYRAAAQSLQVRNANPKQFAHRIIDDRLKGEVTRTKGGDLSVRVLAPVDAKRLRERTLFPKRDMQFTRAPSHD